MFLENLSAFPASGSLVSFPTIFRMGSPSSGSVSMSSENLIKPLTRGCALRDFEAQLKKIRGGKGLNRKRATSCNWLSSRLVRLSYWSLIINPSFGNAKLIDVQGPDILWLAYSLPNEISLA